MYAYQLLIMIIDYLDKLHTKYRTPNDFKIYQIILEETDHDYLVDGFWYYAYMSMYLIFIPTWHANH